MVIKGTLNVEVEGEISSLHPGDSVYIKSRERHSISNPGKEPCVSIWYITGMYQDCLEEMKIKGEN